MSDPLANQLTVVLAAIKTLRRQRAQSPIDYSKFSVTELAVILDMDRQINILLNDADAAIKTRLHRYSCMKEPNKLRMFDFADMAQAYCNAAQLLQTQLNKFMDVKESTNGHSTA